MEWSLKTINIQIIIRMLFGLIELSKITPFEVDWINWVNWSERNRFEELYWLVQTIRHQRAKNDILYIEVISKKHHHHIPSGKDREG